jgi:hypothetical protein
MNERVSQPTKPLSAVSQRTGGYRETAPKKAVFTLVERDGKARSFHVANIDAKNLRPLVMKNASRKSTFMTDEAAYYTKTGREFAAHHTVDHSRTEYAFISFCRLCGVLRARKSAVSRRRAVCSSL